ncbi:unnamed protein product, partial [Mesorhabditis spiculigera]
MQKILRYLFYFLLIIPAISCWIFAFLSPVIYHRFFDKIQEVGGFICTNVDREEILDHDIKPEWGCIPVDQCQEIFGELPKNMLELGNLIACDSLWATYVFMGLTMGSIFLGSALTVLIGWMMVQHAKEKKVQKVEMIALDEC